MNSFLLVCDVRSFFGRILGPKKIFQNLLSLKGQMISKRFFLAEDSPKKRTKTRRILVKTNSFVRFLEEIDDPKNHFEIT